MKKVFLMTAILLLAACAQQHEAKPVIDLPQEQLVKSTYAPVYQGDTADLSRTSQSAF